MYKRLEKLTLGLILFAVGVTLWCVILNIHENNRLEKVCTQEIEATVDIVEVDSNSDVYGNIHAKHTGRMIYHYNGVDYRTSITDDRLQGLKYGDKVDILINPDNAEEVILKE